MCGVEVFVVVVGAGILLRGIDVLERCKLDWERSPDSHMSNHMAGLRSAAGWLSCHINVLMGVPRAPAFASWRSLADFHGTSVFVDNYFCTDDMGMISDH